MPSRLFSICCLAIFLGLATPAVAVTPRLPGAAIDADWFRYLNPRFGAAADIPARGWTVEIPVNGDGVVLSSTRGATITINGQSVRNIVDNADADIPRTISKIFDATIARQGRVVTYSVKRPNFYVVSGTAQGDVFYERVTISPDCPAVYSTLSINYPAALQRMMDPIVSRVSKTLASTCRGTDVQGN